MRLLLLWREPIEKTRDSRGVPCASPWCAYASPIQFGGDAAGGRDPRALDVLDNPLKVQCAPCGLLDARDRFSVARLFAPERTGTIRIPQFHPTRLGSGKGLLGPLSDKPCFQLRDSSHLCQQKLAHWARRHARQITEDQVNIAGHEGAQQVHIACQTVQLGKYELRSYRLGV